AAVVLNYIKRGDARGTWAESHYRWQIRTFWYALLWAVIATVCIFTVVLAVIGFPMLVALTIWLIYRIARGWLRLGDRNPMYVCRHAGRARPGVVRLHATGLRRGTGGRLHTGRAGRYGALLQRAGRSALPSVSARQPQG